jgi:HSP20 family protein
MLMRTDPFREFDRLAQQLLGGLSRPTAMPMPMPMPMPMDAYRKDDTFLVQFDLPGVDPSTIDLTVEKNVLTVSAERRTPEVDQKVNGVQSLITERPQGKFSRQLFLGESLDTEQIRADYSAGVLTLTIPVLEQAKPRRIEITSSETERPRIAA